MTGTATGHPYVFVSYASADRERVLPLVNRLEAAGVKTWIDREGIHGGANYALEIAEAIEHAAVLLLICSPASLSSRNVKQELALAWRFERPYLPLLLDRSRDPQRGRLLAGRVAVDRGAGASGRTMAREHCRSVAAAWDRTAVVNGHIVHET